MKNTLKKVTASVVTLMSAEGPSLPLANPALAGGAPGLTPLSLAGTGLGAIARRLN